MWDVHAKIQTHIVVPISKNMHQSRNKLREILNLDPSCTADCKEPADKIIFAFIVYIYDTYVYVCDCGFDVELANNFVYE